MFATAICYITESKCSSSQWLWLELISMIQDIFQVLERVKESHVVLASDPDHFLYLNVFTKHTQSTVLAHRGLSVLTCWSPTREQGEWTLSKASSESTCAFGRLFHRFVIFCFGFFSPTKINSFQLHRMIKKRLLCSSWSFFVVSGGFKISTWDTYENCPSSMFRCCQRPTRMCRNVGNVFLIRTNWF